MADANTAGTPPAASALTGNLPHLVAARLAHCLDLDGPALAVDTACSSGLVALHPARRSLADGECDIAVVGGVDLHLTATAHQGLEPAQALSPTGRSRAFGASADGFVPGEGGAVLVLRRLDEARRDGDEVLAVVRGLPVPLAARRVCALSGTVVGAPGRGGQRGQGASRGPLRGRGAAGRPTRRRPPPALWDGGRRVGSRPGGAVARDLAAERAARRAEQSGPGRAAPRRASRCRHWCWCRFRQPHSDSRGLQLRPLPRGTGRRLSGGGTGHRRRHRVGGDPAESAVLGGRAAATAVVELSGAVVPEGHRGASGPGASRRTDRAVHTAVVAAVAGHRTRTRRAVPVRAGRRKRPAGRAAARPVPDGTRRDRRGRRR
ncbi:polyketide synthase [Streptomyces sp. NPDC006999]|uniref:beta-ketoacyl [acyl carrier protein] synthase domain-containing protein n=1 Tax=Streptomyces sp. NPDC006999 TaxID=3156909 RepID=UPI0033EF5381